MSDEILAAAATIANEWRTLAVAWHLVAAGSLAALWRRRIEARSVAGFLAWMVWSVAMMAWWSGNPFNATVFGVTGVLMIVIAAEGFRAGIDGASPPDAAAGAIMCAFGWVYPHFLTGPAWQYAFAAPLGLLPCPTLAFIIGVSLLTGSFGSTRWAALFGALGLSYGGIGVFVLDVTIDWMLIASGVLLLVRAAPFRLLEPLAIEREKRRV